MAGTPFIVRSQKIRPDCIRSSPVLVPRSGPVPVSQSGPVPVPRSGLVSLLIRGVRREITEDNIVFLFQG